MYICVPFLIKRGGKPEKLVNAKLTHPCVLATQKEELASEEMILVILKVECDALVIFWGSVWTCLYDIKLST